ncbi:MAG: DNA polymerase II [bacterium]|nr:DNA polymerase II [bacterium]
MAEAAREAARTKPSFAAEVFLGHTNAELVLPFPEQDTADRARGDAFLEGLHKILVEEIDPDEVDTGREIPEPALERLREHGAFRMKIPEKYGGLGFSQANYNRALGLVASHCGSTAILLSGHQSIGVPTPLKLFGTEEQKQRYLPRLAAGAISGFALTEPDVGSDPAKMETTATPSPDGDGWILNGQKLWCTNGPLAELLVVMARTPDEAGKRRSHKRISAFLVETNQPGFEVVHRCDFMGYGGIQSGLLRFHDVRIAKDGLIGEAGKGLKLALITLNTGRLTLPATNTAAAKCCLSIVREWASTREQWGAPVGRHEAVAVQIGWIAAHTFAMEAVCDYVAALADAGDTDIRIDAAMAKLFCSEMISAIADRAMQVRGGRGYETAASLRARGEPAVPLERIYREARLNRIVEGTSEIMRLFLAREALDPHLARAGALANPRASKLAKIGAVLKATPYYAWYLISRLPPVFGAPASIPGPLRGHWVAVRRESRRLSRRLLYAMARHGPALEHRQGILGRFVNDGMDLLAMAASISRGASRGDEASIAMAAGFCRHARARLRDSRRARWKNDLADTRLSARLLEGELRSLEQGIVLPPAARDTNASAP